MSRSRNAVAALMLLVTTALSACADPAEDPETLVASADSELKARLPTIPDVIAVPAGQRLAFTLHAEGVQIYDCKAAAWVFRAPEADLFVGRHVVGSHYAGPTWEAFDGSTVVGSKLAAATVDSTAIPWLLLQAASNTGRGLMSSVTYVQRLSTVGGIAPSTVCDASNEGATEEVDYTATYAFYQAACGR